MSPSTPQHVRQFDDMKHFSPKHIGPQDPEEHTRRTYYKLDELRRSLEAMATAYSDDDGPVWRMAAAFSETIHPLMRRRELALGWSPRW